MQPASASFGLTGYATYKELLGACTVQAAVERALTASWPAKRWPTGSAGQRWPLTGRVRKDPNLRKDYHSAGAHERTVLHVHVQLGTLASRGQTPAHEMCFEEPIGYSYDFRQLWTSAQSRYGWRAQSKHAHIPKPIFIYTLMHARSCEGGGALCSHSGKRLLAWTDARSIACST